MTRSYPRDPTPTRAARSATLPVMVTAERADRVPLDRAATDVAQASPLGHSGGMDDRAGENQGEVHRVAVEHGSLEVTVTGDGEPVLVIPTAVNPYELAPLARLVAASERYRVVENRRRGSGTSSPALVPATIEAEAEDAAAVLAALGIPRAHVVGASYSGAVALALALAHPDVVHTLAVHEPPPTFTSASEEFADAGRDLLALRDREGTEAAIDDFSRRFDGPGWRETLDRVAPGSSAAVLAEADLFFDHDLPALRAWTFDREHAARITCPVLVLGGTASGPWFAEVRTLLTQWLPRTRVVTLQGADHEMCLHRTEEVAEAVISHLTAHPMLPDGASARTSIPLEDYALLSDLHTGPLVSRDGSIDWLCLPRFDSPAVFSALLGTPEDGRWKLSAVGGEVVSRRYLPRTFVLETTWQTPTGTVVVTDFLPSSDRQADVVRRVRCTAGRAQVEHDLRIRFDYALTLPWTRRVPLAGGSREGLLSVAGPDSLLLAGPLLHPQEGSEEDGRGRSADFQGGVGDRLVGTFDLVDGDSLDWVLSWHPSHRFPPTLIDPENAQARTIAYWRAWSANVQVHDLDDEQVLRSLMVLRALTHEETGGIVAASTTSLPEYFGGVRNWDYRFTWLRDAALTIETLIRHDFTEGALHWRDWLLRAVAGDPDDLQIMYGVAGERQLPERELDHLAGYENSRPVRIGNGAATQYQADVVGEVMLALAALREAGVAEDEYSWGLQQNLLRFVERNWDRQGHGIWEMRGEPAIFTHGRAMMWAALNEGVRAVEEHGLYGPVERWRGLRDRLQAEIDDHGFNAGLNSFTQTYTTTEVDASLLQLPHTGFLTYDDPRMLGTVARIEADLLDRSGLLRRYRTEAGLDGLPGDEYPFLICSFWLVEQYARSDRLREARTLLDRLEGFATDLGLYSEEYDTSTSRLAGNFPQAFSHLGFIRAVDAVEEAEGRGRLSERDRRPTAKR